MEFPHVDDAVAIDTALNLHREAIQRLQQINTEIEAVAEAQAAIRADLFIPNKLGKQGGSN